MKHSWIWLLGLFLSSQSVAKEGFSIGLGIGAGFFRLSDDSLSSSLQEINRPSGEGDLLTSTLSDGLALRFSMAYTIRGYVSIEMGMTGHGWNLSSADSLGGSGHASLVVHFHPLQLWLPDRDYDATVFLGGGYSILGGGQESDDLDRGLDGGALECGLTGRYFLTPWFSIGGELRLDFPFYSRWFVEWNRNETYDLDSSPTAVFVSLLVLTTFHFDVSQ